MKLVRPVTVAPGVYQLHAIGARVTVLFADDGVVLVDAGGRGSGGLISAGLKALGSSLNDIRLVILTHSHPDHSGGLAKLVEVTGAKVAVHRQEAPIINGQEPLPSPHRRALVASFTRPFLPLLYGGTTLVDFLLEDGDILPMAEEVRIIHTPGHTPGSICLYVVSQRVLIVGDALSSRFGRLGPPAPSVTQDVHQALESLRRLTSLDFDVICFSHFPPLRRNAREALQHMIQRVAP